MDRDEREVLEARWYTHPPMRNALLAGLLTGIAFALRHTGLIPDVAETSIYIVAILLGGYHWSREGLEEIFTERRVGIEILMMGATIGSAILGMWDEAAFLVFLYGTAEGIEEYTYAKTRHSIRKLLDLAPKEARVIRNGGEETIPAEALEVGDVFVVRPGESMPTDGVVVSGSSSVNEAPVTGESIPVEKKPESKVFAATMNLRGCLEVRVTATFENNTLAKMIHLVEEAQEQKGKAQLFIESFGDKYSPIVLVSAVLLATVVPLLGGSVSEWATRAVVLLVAAAPCALVMSTPVAVAAGIGKAGRSGILIKGGVHLENLGKVKVVAFDKTGTLTKGKPVVTDVWTFNGNEQDLLRLCYSIERLSEHPLAEAVVEKAEGLGIAPLDVTDFEALTGEGVKAQVQGKTTYVGRPELFASLGLSLNDKAELERLRNGGKTVIYVGTDEHIMGAIGIRDEIRPQASEVIGKLHSMGIKTVMLTGDNETTARTIAAELGIDDVRANLKPEDKIEAVRRLEEEYGAVIMIGDGINDAPALARASVGIAMGAAGTDAAIEAADVALMGDDIARVPYAVSLGRRARNISRQNIVFSLLILAVLIPAALLGVMSVAVAVFAHETSEILAVLNGLRVSRVSR
ncbi:MAG: cadmium-translocating P-type ATPase [Armatimonadetes bacterium]|nr:cadmium-translocating P-type ATPase [Armatimonadota bacterium]